MSENKKQNPTEQRPIPQGRIKKDSLGEMFSGGGSLDNSDLINIGREKEPPPKNQNSSQSSGKKD
ncbi:MAG: hypothetical protein H0Z35_09255 [Thermoanaerobacteraceae bacterium]|nr:hypothetical protein [Thermoanaerobacteraceae bacterium]